MTFPMPSLQLARPGADSAPPPIPETSLRTIVGEIAANFGMSVAMLRENGEPVAVAGPETIAVPTPGELAGQVYGAREPRWHNLQATAIVRLVIPIFSRRLVWGYLIASYRYASTDARCKPDQCCESDPPIYTLAAAPNLLKAIQNAINSAVLIHQQLEDLDDLSGKMLQSYEEISLLYRLGQHFNVTMGPTEVLDYTCRELQKVLGQYRSVACMATPPSSPIDVDGPVNSSAGIVKMSREDVANLFEWYRDQPLNWGQPYIENGILSHREGAPHGVFERLLMVPVCYQSEMLGLLVSASSMDAVEFDSRDAQLVANLATQIGAHWKNFLLFDELRQLLFALVRALVSAIDAKDPYTCGHSERVAMVARRLAAAASLQAEQVEEIYLSGLLHDIGKIGIREDVLLKPTSLSADEWDHLRQHPDIGARILQPVGAIAKVVPGVKHHHECYNGRGYPSGLKGTEIPVMARIIAVADAFDAMSTDRPYRKALSLEEMRNVFVGGAGEQWDRDFVEIFVELLADDDFVSKYNTLRKNYHR